MKKTLTVVLALVFALPLFAQNSLWFDGPFEKAMEKAQTTGKSILIDFYSAG